MKARIQACILFDSLWLQRVGKLLPYTAISYPMQLLCLATGLFFVNNATIWTSIAALTADVLLPQIFQGK